jgi:hypothetical protein
MGRKRTTTMHNTPTTGARQGLRISLLCALLGAMGLPPAFSAEGASTASIEQLVALNGAQKALEAAVANIEVQVRQQVVMTLQQQNGGRPLTLQQQAVVDKAVPGIAGVLRQELGWAQMKAAYLKLYQDQLSAAQVQRLITLYQDPGYVVMMQKMQTINQGSVLLVNHKLPLITQRIQPVLQEALQLAPVPGSVPSPVPAPASTSPAPALSQQAPLKPARLPAPAPGQATP